MPEPNSGCWLWCYRNTRAGYGRMPTNGYAHRACYESVHGAGSAKGLEVRHLCDTPCCVNPSHLLLGTHTDNMRDMVDRYRGNHFTGEGAAHAKLTNSAVLDARKRVSCGELCSSIAAEYGVSHDTIRAATTGKTWKHIPGALGKRGLRLGSRNPQSKLTETDVVDIKRRMTRTNHQELGDEFGVSAAAIFQIYVGRNWRHVVPSKALEGTDPHLFG